MTRQVNTQITMTVYMFGDHVTITCEFKSVLCLYCNGVFHTWIKQYKYLLIYTGLQSLLAKLVQPQFGNQLRWMSFLKHIILIT